MDLSVNIDHIATLREARRELIPDPVHAAVEAELGGCDGITVHLRHDRRHINERDIRILRETVRTELNVEMSATQEMEKIMAMIRPHRITLVPETSGEITTQGGLNLLTGRTTLKKYIKRLQAKNIRVGIFLDPDIDQIKAALKLGAQYIEINTAGYCANANARSEIVRITRAARFALRGHMAVHAGHGIDYRNIGSLLSITEITGYSIGFAIVARAVFVGLRRAVEDMAALIKGAP